MIIGLIGMRATHFLVWAPYSTRAQRLSKPLGASLDMLSYKTKNKIYAPLKYPFLFCKTLTLLASKKPNDAVIICQSPPIFSMKEVTKKEIGDMS